MPGHTVGLDVGHTEGLDVGHTVGLSLYADVVLWPLHAAELQCPALILPWMRLRPTGKGNTPAPPVPSFSKTQLLALQRCRQCW